MDDKKNKKSSNYVRIGHGNMDYGFGRGNANNNYPLAGIGGGPADIRQENDISPEDEEPDNNRMPEI